MVSYNGTPLLLRGHLINLSHCLMFSVKLVFNADKTNLMLIVFVVLCTPEMADHPFQCYL